MALHSEPFEEWLRGERLRLHALAEGALARLLAYYDDDAATEHAIRVAVRLLGLAPLREDAHRTLMRLYAESGQRTHALKQYELCRELLQRELNIAPEAQTQQLAERIRSRRLAASGSMVTAEQREGTSANALPEMRRADAGEAAADSDVPTKAPSAERRYVTVLSCDLINAPALATGLELEDLRDVIAAYQECCQGIIDRFAGYVAKRSGEWLLVCFGYPQAHERDAERAVRAGLEIVTAVAQLKVQGGSRLQCQVGIASGEVVAGDVGDQPGFEAQAIVGDPPSMAARLQAVAAPGTVVLADSTRKVVGGQFEYENLGRQCLGGLEGPVQVWRALTARAAEGDDFGPNADAGLSRLVGREDEIGLLRQRWRQAKAGRGQIVLITGEPGIGKSRLAHQLRAELAEEPHIFVNLCGSPYHRDTALFPVINQLELAAGFRPDDSPAVKLDKLEALLAQFLDRTAEVTPLFAALLSIRMPRRYRPPVLTPVHQRERTLDALETQLVALASKKPLLLIFEGAHWIDATTCELLDRVAACVATLPVLLLLTHRPGFSLPWTDAAHVTTVTLRRLDAAASETLVRELAGARTLAPELLTQIVSKTDGVPLFVEELAKAVLDDPYLKEEGHRPTLGHPLALFAVPGTLRDSLMARLDRLGPAKVVAQVAAVIGPRFSYELIAAVSPLAAVELRQALAKLADAELIHARGTPPAATYAFKHVLVQEAAYMSLLRADRESLHARIVDALEQRCSKPTANEFEFLAHHCEGAGRMRQALFYWQQAGRSIIEDFMRPLQGLCETSAVIRGRDFQDVARDILSTRPYVDALEWAPCVRWAERAAYEAQIRDKGHPDVGIWELDDTRRVVPAGQRARYFPVHEVEPLSGNEVALGFDLASEPTRSRVLRRSLDTGKLRATPSIALVRGNGKQNGFLAFLPIYVGKPVTAVERRRMCRGFMLGVFSLNEGYAKAMQS